MKLPLIIPVLISLLCISNQIKATHIIAGQITATSTSDQSNSYQIKFTLYSDFGSELTFGAYEIYLGSGQPVNADGMDFKNNALNEDSLIKISTLEIDHTFPGSGVYVLSFREFSRTHDIVNISNSVNTPFYMETKLTVDPLSGKNSTPVLSDPESFDANVKTKFIQNIGATDPDGDSLSYEMVVPKQDKSVFVEGYYPPHRVGISSASPPSREDGTLPAFLGFEGGQLIWDAPAYGGQYTIAFQVKEWRKIQDVWKEIGYVTRDFTVYVADTVDHSYGGDYITATEKETEKQETILYPNPTDGKFHLKISDPWINSQLSVQDITGKLIYQNAVNQNEILLELPSLSSGLYILTLQKGMKRKTFTFVKQ